MNIPEDTKKEIIEAEKKKIKATRTGERYDKFGEEYVKPGDNSRFLRNALAIYNLPIIDISDANQVSERIQWYFVKCTTEDLKPSVNGLSLALGVDRTRLIKWATGFDRKGSKHQEVAKRALQVMESLWEDYMQNGKINPVSGIFLGKNHFAYRDQSEVVLTPNNPLGDTGDPEAIRRRYLEIGTDSE